MCKLKNTVKDFLKKYNLTETNEPVLLGFSGGFDSLCLLDILHKLGLEIVALHLNHNWRGAESYRDFEFCKNFCLTNNIKFYSETLDDTIPHTETAAREARYDFFNRAAKKFSSNIIFTAHNANDNAETILYRIIKGTGIEGLSAIAEKRGNFYRPLLNIQRADIENYCKTNNLIPIIDSSNNNTKYKRNFIRHKIMPLLEEINPNAIQSINTMSEIAKEETEIIDEYVSKILQNTQNSTKKFLELPISIQNKIIYKLFRENNLDYDREKILQSVNFIKTNANLKSGKTLSITTNLWLFTSDKTFYFFSKNKPNDIEVQINKIGDYNFSNGKFSIIKCEQSPTQYPKDCDCVAYIFANTINYTLRYRKDGDYIYPLGAGGKQKLKKYFNSKKIPNHLKDTIPLLCSGQEVLWVIGYGISERLRVENKPSYMLKFTNNNEVGYGN